MKGQPPLVFMNIFIYICTMNGVSNKILSGVMMMLIVVGVCSSLVCSLHDCCVVANEQRHICCHCDDHVDECCSHDYTLEHKCYSSELMSAEWTVQERMELQHFIVAYTFIYNHISVGCDQPSYEVWRCEVFIDSPSPSTRLLRAPPVYEV